MVTMRHSFKELKVVVYKELNIFVHRKFNRRKNLPTNEFDHAFLGLFKNFDTNLDLCKTTIVDFHFVLFIGNFYHKLLAEND